MRTAPACGTALALYGFPYALALALDGGGAWYGLLAADVLALAAVATFLWSPLMVLAAAILSTVFFVLALLGAYAADACGTFAAVAAGGALLVLTVGTWGVRRGARALWVIPVVWIMVAAWIVNVSHLIPGGPCSE